MQLICGNGQDTGVNFRDLLFICAGVFFFANTGYITIGITQDATIAARVVDANADQRRCGNYLWR